jgi:hypothetical protein
MACAPYAPGMARMMADRVMTLPAVDAQLHVIYLANDILFKALGQRPAGTPPAADAIAMAFAPVLGAMLAAAAAAAYAAAAASAAAAAGAAAAAAGDGGAAAEGGAQPPPDEAQVQQAFQASTSKLDKMLSFWRDKGVLDAAALDTIAGSMAARDARAALAIGMQLSPATAEAAGHMLAQDQAVAAATAAAAAAAMQGAGAQGLPPPHAYPPGYPAPYPGAPAYPAYPGKGPWLLCGFFVCAWLAAWVLPPAPSNRPATS